MSVSNELGWKLIFMLISCTDDEYIKIDDMMLLRKRIKLLHEERERRHAVADSELLWPNGVVPYVITSVFDGKLTKC